jgi:hypothetical protein
VIHEVLLDQDVKPAGWYHLNALNVINHVIPLENYQEPTVGQQIPPFMDT